MKTKKFIFLSLIAIVFLSTCAKHDFFDDITITGNVGPQAYWEVGSSTVSAGSDVSFDVQYYSTVAEIDRSEVWYNITETEERVASCPWVTSRTYSISSVRSEEKRIAQKIQEYPHSLAVWSDSLHAYVFSDKFPVSPTLSRFDWVKPAVFDYDKMEAYFGLSFIQLFRDSLRNNIMVYSDWKNMMLGLNILDDFKQYTDSTPDPNAGEDAWTFHFPKDAQGNTPVPADLIDMYNDIPFDRLIGNATGYNVEYKRTYSMRAILRVYDNRGVYGTTVSKEIDIN